MCPNPTKAAGPARSGDAIPNLAGFSRTMNDLSMVTEVIEDGPNTLVYEQRIYRKAPPAVSPASLPELQFALAEGGAVEYCQRCIVDLATRITVCHPIPCPKIEPKQPEPQDPPKA